MKRIILTTISIFLVACEPTVHEKTIAEKFADTVVATAYASAKLGWIKGQNGSSWLEVSNYIASVYQRSEQ